MAFDIASLLQMLSGQGAQGAPDGSPSALPSDVSSLLAQSPQGGAPDPTPQAQAPVQPNGPMAQPPAAPPGPSTPPETDAGLGGFLSRMVQKATNRDPDTGMSFMDKLGQMGAQMTDQMGDTQGAQKALQLAAAKRVTDTQADQRREQMAKMADALNLSPADRLRFYADPDAYVASMNKVWENQNEVHDIGGGNTATFGKPGTADATTVTAPKVGVENGEAYSVTPNGAKDLGGLGLSPQQQLQDQIKQAQQAAIEAYHQTMAKIAQQNANANTTRANKPSLGNGGDWRSRVVGRGSIQ
jgi:hypothetical protein